MTNEEIVFKIKCSKSVTDNMQLLYERNMPLIKKHVKPYSKYEPMEDLLQEAYFGLWKAVQHYETTENVLFMTYAAYWIRQAVSRYVERCGSVLRVPNHMYTEVHRYKKAVETLQQEKCKTPTLAEIADHMKLSVAEVKNIRLYMQDISSLDAPLQIDEELTLGDSVQDDFDLENSVLDKIYGEQAKGGLWPIVERYTDTVESEVLKDIFIHKRTLTAISRERNISIQRVREIKAKGLRRLRVGRAKRELSERFEIAETSLYKTGLNAFENWGESSVEYIVRRRLEAQKGYDRALKKFGV